MGDSVRNTLGIGRILEEAEHHTVGDSVRNTLGRSLEEVKNQSMNLCILLVKYLPQLRCGSAQNRCFALLFDPM